MATATPATQPEMKRSPVRPVYAAAVVLVVVIALAGGILAARSLTGGASIAPPPHSERIGMAGQRLLVGCAGQGSPTALLMTSPWNPGNWADAGPLWVQWSRVWPRVQRFTHYCTFQAPTLGERGAPRDSDQTALLVHALLRKAGVHGPYVLASSNGPDARAFIARYPGEVQGLVLADSSGDGGVRDFLRTLGPQRPGESQDVADLRQVLRDHGPDQDYLRASDRAVSHDGRLGHLPLIVISRGEDNQWPASFSPPSVRRALEADVMRRQNQLAALSTNSTHLIARQSGDQIAGMFWTQPDLIAASIRQVVVAARHPGSTLPACVVAFQRAIPSSYRDLPPFQNPEGTQKPPLTCLPRGRAPVIDGIPCQIETLVRHEHAHLTLLVSGRSVAIPAGIGVSPQHDCLYWLHTHDPDGVIHMESPRNVPYTLGMFFDIWRQHLSRSQVWKYRVPAGRSMRVYVGKALYRSNPRTIRLRGKTAITIEIGPPFRAPGSFDFGAL